MPAVLWDPVLDNVVWIKKAGKVAEKNPKRKVKILQLGVAVVNGSRRRPHESFYLLPFGEEKMPQIASVVMEHVPDEVYAAWLPMLSSGTGCPHRRCSATAAWKYSTAR